MSFKNVSVLTLRDINQIWAAKGSDFYNKSVISWFQENVVAMYTTHNEAKSVFVERFTRTLKNKICKYMTAISKHVFIDELDDAVN